MGHPVCFSMSVEGPTLLCQSRITAELTKQDGEQG